MDLNRLNSGKKFIEQVIKQGNTSLMGWTKDQREQNLSTRKNTHTIASRASKNERR